MQQLAQESMNPDRKEELRHILKVYAHSYIPGPSVWAMFARHGVAYAALALLLMAGGTTAVAQRSGPEDLLYSMRLAVNDRIAVAVSGDEDAKLEKELEQMERMIDDEEDALEDEAIEQEDEDFRELEEELSDEEKNFDEDNGDSLSAEVETEDDTELERELRDILKDIEEAASEELSED